MSTAVVTRERVHVLDGIRGLAIVLVLLSHTWIVTPANDLRSNPPLWWLFSSGNFAVSIFFVVSGFLATQGMLRAIEATGTLRFGVVFLRRWIRISAHVYPLVIAVLALTAIDTNMAVYQQNDTRSSAWAILTYTWSGYIRKHTLEARPDLGHLWYVGADIWVIGLILVLAFLLGRRRPLFFAALAAILVVVMIYRPHVYETEGLHNALTRIQTRADGLLWGAMTAVALPWVSEKLTPYARQLQWASSLLLLPLMVAVNDPARYFGWTGQLLNLDLAVFVIATALVRGGAVSTFWSWKPLVTLGRYSLVLYIWHYPIFWYFSRNYLDSSWQFRAAISYLLTFVVAFASQRLIERPVTRWLASPGWRALDHGIVPALGTLARDRSSWMAKWRSSRAEASTDPVDPELSDTEFGDVSDSSRS